MCPLNHHGHPRFLQVCKVTYAKVQGREKLHQHFSLSFLDTDETRWLPVMVDWEPNVRALPCEVHEGGGGVCLVCTPLPAKRFFNEHHVCKAPGWILFLESPDVLTPPF